MPSTAYADGPRLVADIGGTHARFALESAPGILSQAATLPCARYQRFEDAVTSYLACFPELTVRHAVVAIANPVHGDSIRMTNHHWGFSVRAAAAALGFDTLLVVNDFAALAMAVPQLQAADLEQVGQGSRCAGAVIGLLGAGTGLGVAGLVEAGGRHYALQSEGGHVAFSPRDEREMQILRYCWRFHEHVSAERLVSGPGLKLIYAALADASGDIQPARPTPEQIIAAGLDGSDHLARATLDAFCAMLGTVAGDLAVTLNAHGGVYIGGGVVPRLGGFFAASGFRRRFESKGRFSDFNAQIPTYVIRAPYPALAGAATMLRAHLRQEPARPPMQSAANDYLHH
ncbi:glucokinase [Massilia sp. TS11]|uniref:glucokinase n=1 Tax=Massilia sp. TS11 TaxID=2908003 RepID=UPI001EDAF0EF|nr:glucokinase [Massilia sp. TS11]MCG2586289.1 glucokinase [Massilia sp. TS11]